MGFCKDAKDYVGQSVLKSTYNNVLNLLDCKPDLFDAYRYNEFTQDDEVVSYKPWMRNSYPGKMIDDRDILLLKDRLRAYSIQPPTATIHEAVSTKSLKHAYHPVKDYLTSLKWDGEARLNHWLPRYCNAEDTDYTRYISRLILCAACARIDKPGIKYDYMLILEGKQGIKKSSLVSALGGAWAGSINIVARDRDTIDKMRGKWFIEVPELVCFRKQDIESLKDFISTSTDRTRLAYARKAQDFPRQSIFIGTFNPRNFPQGYFQDDENRRFFPVTVDNIDAEGVARDRDQLFAEAWHTYKKGMDLTIRDKKVLAMAMDQQTQRKVYDDMEDEVAKFLKSMSESFVRGVDIFCRVFGKNKGDFDAKEQRRISMIMQSLGWERKQKRVDGHPSWGYENLNHVQKAEGDAPDWVE